MEDHFSVLLVHDQEEPFHALEQILLSQGIRTEHARTCSEAGSALRGPCSARVVLTDTSLSDGTWADVLDLASVVPVVVVSRLVDIDLYLNVLESGAADFISPPVSSDDLAYVIKTSIGRNSGNGPVKRHRVAAA
jgi:DNA-binding NtrC family response regulator